MVDPYSGSFKASQRKGRKAPQMGFYRKKPKTNIFSKARHALDRALSDKNVKHKMDNDKRSSSQNYSNERSKESNNKMNKGFIKGKRHKSKRKHKKSDRNSDSFSAPQNKKR
ncbi:MAG: hypothetical protein H0X62_16335 [Bacteroidetes bacterium]|nr:hypothetical protein [Bacteroidota bacterium]